MAYRDTIYEKGEELLNALGSFWYNIFQDADKLSSMYKGTAIEAGQAYQTYLESVAAISRFEIPVFHKEHWYFLTISENDLNTKALRYGDGALYGQSYQYGVRSANTKYSIDLTNNLKKAPVMFNRIINPSLTWLYGLDYIFEDDTLVFFNNPFDNDLIPRRDIIGSDGAVSDREIGLWLYMAEFDLDYVYKHFGYVLGIQMPSSEVYKTFINALWDSYTDGPTLRAMQNALSAMSGAPSVIEPVETVEVILELEDKLQIITDKHVYDFSPNANPLVSVGDLVYGGDPLTDVVQIVELNSTPDITTLPALALTKDYLSGGYRGDLVFENKNVTVDYGGIDDNNKAVISFEISGFDDDISKFWDSVHSAGVAAGKTLAECLDIRDDPVGPPLPTHLPDMVNPLEFLLNNLLGNNMYMIKLRPEAYANETVGKEFFNYMRNIVPPHTSFVVYVEDIPDILEYSFSVNGNETMVNFDGDIIEDEYDLGDLNLMREVLFTRAIEGCSND